MGLIPKNILESFRIGGKLLGASKEKKVEQRERERERERERVKNAPDVIDWWSSHILDCSHSVVLSGQLEQQNNTWGSKSESK